MLTATASADIDLFVWMFPALHEKVHIRKSRHGKVFCNAGPSLKQKCHHFDKIFITDVTGSCHFDNFQKWQLPVQPVMKVSSKWHLHFSVCEENLLVTREFSSQRASGMELCYLFVVILNKLLNKLWSHWWFEMGWHSGDITVMNVTRLFMGKGGAPQMWSALFS